MTENSTSHRPDKIPATVVTGFLGAGKTTLIRGLIERANGTRIALVVNEFGDLGIDGELLAECGNPECTEDDIFELPNGCICCTVADDFLPTIEKILARPEPPDHIVIETSGLALPKPLVQAFNWPEVRTRVTVDGVVTVVDAAALAEGRMAPDMAALEAQREADPNLDHESPIEELYEDQLACADLVAVTKADLIDDSAIEAVEQQIATEIRPGVRTLRTRKGDVDPRALLGLCVGAEDDIENRPSHHDGEDDHEHDDFESFVVAAPAVDDPAELADRIRSVSATHNLLRVKGFADVSGKAMRLSVQAVGPRVETYFGRPWKDGEIRSTRLVVIGESGIDRDAVAGALGGDALPEQTSV